MYFTWLYQYNIILYHTTAILPHDFLILKYHIYIYIYQNIIIPNIHQATEKRDVNIVCIAVVLLPFLLQVLSEQFYKAELFVWVL